MQEAIIEIEQSKLDIPTLKINNYYIHSKYNPLKEAEQFAVKNYNEGNLHVILGNGLGYYSEAFYKIIANKESIIVYEPFGNLPDSAFDFVYSDLNLFKEALKAKVYQFKELNVISIPNYLKFFQEIHKEILQYSKDQIIIKQIFENTINRYSQEWQENYLHNLTYTIDDYQIQRLEKSYDSPVIVASAGPSLAKQIPLLKQYRERIILVAAGSSITALMKYDLEPDFVVTMDGGLPNSVHFNSVKLQKANLVYSLVTHYNVRKNITASKCYHYLSTDCYDMEGHYSSILKQTPLKLEGSGSVATYALSFARFISSGPIALVGQDLAYTNDRSHDANNLHSSGISKEYIEQNGLFITTDVNGLDVYTDYAFLAMKESFESLVQQLDNRETIFNCTEGGLSIKNIKNNFLQQFLLEFATTSVEHKVDEEKNVTITNLDLLNQLKNELNNLELGIQLVKENLKLLQSTQSSRVFKASILNKMEKNENELLVLTERLSISIAMKKTLIKFMQAETMAYSDTEYMKYKKVYEKNKMLYTELLDILESTKVILESIINN